MTGADLLVRALQSAGVEYLFSLSGNQILPIYDAALDAGLRIVHVRHEAAAVHMADAWGRLTGRPGVALVTAGPGHANALSAAYVALAAESPLVLLSGGCPRPLRRRGGFQDVDQADMARPVTRLSREVDDPRRIPEDLAEAFRAATTGRPGPVHLTLPADVLEATVDVPDDALPLTGAFEQPSKPPLAVEKAERIADALLGAKRPIVLLGPAVGRAVDGAQRRKLAEALGAPLIVMESPRGILDPAQGVLAEVLGNTDCVLLLGKELDFTLRFGQSPPFAPGCRFLQVDAEQAAIDRARGALGDAGRLVTTVVADPSAATHALSEATAGRNIARGNWLAEVEEALQFRLAEWHTVTAGEADLLHPAELCRLLQQEFTEDTVLICEGGEFGQWSQACLRAPRRLINGPSGSIGSAVPFALAAKLALPESRVVTMTGDGAFGFHALEFDTAVRYGVPFVAVVGNDAAWNAEKQLQIARYGAERVNEVDLLPTRYDQLVETLGGHGEYVDDGSQLSGALERAFASGKPACINVRIEGFAAPRIERPTE